MIRFKLKELLAKREFSAGTRIMWADVAAATHIHRVTLSKIANEKGYNVGSDNINRLCAYFGCQPNDLMEFIPHQSDLLGESKKSDVDQISDTQASVPATSQKRPRTVPKKEKTTTKRD